jgi:RNA polymerase sigma-70 factor (ECF subfamily)
VPSDIPIPDCPGGALRTTGPEGLWMDDAELVRQVLRGNRAAFEDLVKRYTSLIASVCRANLPWYRDIDDVVQETFVRALERLSDLRDPERIGSWLRSIARNLCREQRKDPHSSHLSLDAAPAPVAANDNGENDTARVAAQLRVCVRKLPRELREVIELYYGGGRVTYDAVADLLGVSFGRVNQMLTMARKLLRDCLKQGGVNL